MYERIRGLREDKDMTQMQMAKYLCCSQRVYSNYERGEVEMPVRVLIELAKFHKTSIDYLLELTDEKTPYPPKKKKSYL
ncbi:MAG: helix-turn-helix transcriptional regulator [Tyzzerella sp.]|nr:helix-turn-helix transcriptional regulator [Tyzzerella sp.]